METIVPVYGVSGHEALDRDHEVVLRLLDGLISGQSWRERRPGAVEAELCAYLDAHFENEEQLMEQQEYPGTAAHKSEHVALKERVLSALDVCTRERSSIPICPRALEQMLRDHMLGADTEFAAFLVQRSVPAAETRSGFFDAS